MSEGVLDRVRAFAGGLGLELAPLAGGLAELGPVAERAGAAVAVRHDRLRAAVRVRLAEAADRAVLPRVVDALAARTAGIRALAGRARAVAAAGEPVAVELETTVPPRDAGLAIHGAPRPVGVVLDELVAIGMPAAEARRARALIDLVERESADAVSWRVRAPALLTATLAFAGDGPDAIAWAAGCTRALSMVVGLEPAGRALIDQILDAGLPVGRPVVSLTCTADGVLPRVGLDLDDTPVAGAGAVLARLPRGAPSLTTAASAPVFGAAPLGTVSLVLGDEPFGSLVVAFLPG